MTDSIVSIVLFAILLILTSLEWNRSFPRETEETEKPTYQTVKAYRRKLAAP